MTTLSSINFINQVQMPLYRWCSLHEAEPSEVLKDTINRYLNDRCSNMAANDEERIKSRHHDIAAGIIFFCCNFCHRDEIEKMESIAPMLARNF